MKREDITLGMKVVPHQKTVCFWTGLNNSEVWKCAIENGQNYLYVISENIKDNCFILNDELNIDSEGNYEIDGDYFNPEDFKPYVES